MALFTRHQKPIEPMKTIRCLTPEEFKAIQAAAYLHGRNFKSAIYRAWYSGAYNREMLGDYSGTLQRMRNTADGQDLLESLRTKDFVANKATAYLMGRNAARGEGGGNPFGVHTLAEAWRKGYRETLATLPESARPVSPFLTRA
jgi:hypothetical protein